jgi:hypothetical protein
MSVHEISFGLSDARLLLEQLRIAARSDGASPKSFALLLRRVFEEHAWTEEGFATFRAYVKADEPYGLGMTEERLLDAARLAGVESLARSLLYEETEPERRVGRPKSGEENLRVTKIKPETDTSEYIVARLKRDGERDPEAAALAAKVISGEVSPNAAAREKGWRKPRIVLSSPERIAESLRRYMPRESLLRLIELLTKED